jgi:hypothetical protein
MSIQLSGKRFTVLATVLSLGMLAVVGMNNRPPTPEQAAVRAQQSREDAADATRRQAVVVATAALLKNLRDPDSLVIEKRSASEDGKSVCLVYRARNGFGGMDRGLMFFNFKNGTTSEIECPALGYSY